MKLDPEALQQVVGRTLDHYQARAAAFWEGTRHHDVEQNIEALLHHLQGPPPFELLDFGCGPGRDLKAFVERGHRAIGLEGAPALAEMARAHSGCEIWQQNFLQLDLPDGRFDGVFANASLFHVPRQELARVLRQLPSEKTWKPPESELARVLRQLHATLKPQGVLFSSNPRGENEESINGERYGAYYDLATWRDCLVAAGFVELEHYYRPAVLPREQQPWLASVWRRVEKL